MKYEIYKSVKPVFSIMKLEIYKIWIQKFSVMKFQKQHVLSYPRCPHCIPKLGLNSGETNRHYKVFCWYRSVLIRKTSRESLQVSSRLSVPANLGLTLATVLRAIFLTVSQIIYCTHYSGHWAHTLQVKQANKGHDRDRK